MSKTPSVPAPPATVGAKGVRHRVVYLTNHAPKKYLRAGKPHYLTFEEALSHARDVNSKHVWVVTENIEVFGVHKL